MTAPAQPVQGVEAVADDLAKAADFVARTAEAVHAAINSAIRLCQIHASECIDENPERQKLRLAVFSALEMPTINSHQASVTARRIADRLASPALAPEAPAGKFRDALKRIAEHPEKSDNPLGSYDVGFAFWSVQKIARAALATQADATKGDA